MSRLAPSSNLHGWRPVTIDRERYFENEVRAFRATLDDIRNLPETTHQESHQ